MQTVELISYIDQMLQADKIKDYCPNGLQIQGKSDIQKVVTGVTASQALVDETVALEADALLVHHGYFWKNENPTITGMKYNRLKALMKADINLIAYHLPLDVHPEVGNNAQLANLLEIENVSGLDPHDPFSVGLQGFLAEPVTGEQLGARIASVLGRTPLHIPGVNRSIEKVGWCSGGGQSFIEQAAMAGCDAFISGEVSEQTVHIARELEIDFFAAGHHATERYGVKALGELLAEQFGLDVTFVDIDNPV